MDFADKIIELQGRVISVKDHICNEEATKNSLVMPFLHALGYDIFDPRIVLPEYTADVATKKNEKVDYAIMKNGDPIMLIEVKSCGSTLDQGKAYQLHRYFQNTPSARVGILTDGISYEFYSDLDKPNIMDSRPFMVINLLAIDDSLIPELKKLTADIFDETLALGAAQSLKYTREIKKLIHQEFTTPSKGFVKHFAGQVYDGHMMASVIDSFTDRVRRAFQDFINDHINERLENAIHKVTYEEAVEPVSQDHDKPQIVTTEQEVEAFLTVKAILRQAVDISRVVMRDALSYCSVLLDDNNRKPICRIYMNTSNWYLGLFDENKTETKHKISGIDDIFQHADALKATTANYDK